MVESVLIANRGEIAVRIARSARAVGIRTIAVHSDADAGARHVAAADEAVRIGPAPARDSYLSVEAILAAARATGAAAVHPGYGFLSESPALARACADAGLAFVGPPAAAIELMGDKARAKAAARAAGVPVVPGLEGADLDVAAIAAFCDEHGLPVVVKAVAGGGGRGLRVVRERGELEEAVAAARREAAAAFGDDRVLVERYLDRPRHIEVQVLADGHGGCVHLGERECSLQRRHQKVVEEAPSPVVDTELRERMGAAAVALAATCGYVGAGTVELIAPASDPSDFAFLEMNTRLQVEHPVTEAVYGIDLVAEQLRIASGERLTFAQAEIAPRGHAVEARVYAEDPAAGFLPATGTLRRWREPAGAGLRVDGGVREGDAIATHYDPLLAKAIAHGPDRRTALERLRGALARLDPLGVPTSAGFTRALLARADVRAGELDTGLLERALAGEDGAGATAGGGDGADSGRAGVDGGWGSERARAEAISGPSADLLAAGALAAFLLDRDAHAATTTVPFGWGAAPWRRGFEDGTVEIAGTPAACELRVDGGVPRAAAVRWLDRPADARAPAAAGTAAVEVALDGVARRYAVAWDGETVWAGRDGYQRELRPAAGRAGVGGQGVDGLEAPMPGTVLAVKVANGDEVSAGEVLVVLESMKMELSIEAPHDGTVADLELAAGDRVAQRQPLLTVTP